MTIPQANRLKSALLFSNIQLQEAKKKYIAYLWPGHSGRCFSPIWDAWELEEAEGGQDVQAG